MVFTPDGNGGEHWQRQFADRRYQSAIAAGTGRDAGFLIEHFGLFDLKFRLTPQADGLQWSLAGWRFAGIRLPRWSVPKIECLESADGERFTFDIDVTFPLIGWLIHYRGWLMPQNSRPPTHGREFRANDQRGSASGCLSNTLILRSRWPEPWQRPQRPGSARCRAPASAT